MADKSKKKEKHRLKRLKKQKAIKKAKSITPLQRMALGDAQLECWVNAGWEEEGLASAMVFGADSRGLHAFASFLIDVWCVGLKDAWGRTQMNRPEFNEMLKRGRGRLELEPIETTELRRLVVGAIQFSRQNGFKLPVGWEKWTAIFGNLGDINSADLTGFGIDGGLRYVGDLPFLSQRLIGCTPEEFIRRPDVHYVMGLGGAGISNNGIEWDDDDEEEDDDEDVFDDDDEVDESEDVELDEEAFMEALPKIAGAMSNAGDEVARLTAAWCAARGIVPHPRLAEAARAFVITVMTAESVGAKIFNETDLRTEIERFVAASEISLPDEFMAAVDQVIASRRKDQGDGSSQTLDDLIKFPRLPGR